MGGQEMHRILWDQKCFPFPVAEALDCYFKRGHTQYSSQYKTEQTSAYKLKLTCRYETSSV